MQQLMKNYSTMFLVRGIAAIVFGIITLVWPRLTLSTLVILFGIFAIISGAAAGASALQNRDVHGWGLHLCEGILAVLVGVVTLAWPGITALAFLFLLAAWAITTGIIEFTAPFLFPMRGLHAGLLILTGLASVVFGILLAARPATGILTVTLLIGIYAIVIGVLYCVHFFEVRSASREVSPARTPYMP
ncbi:hypothetical protein KDH_71550 [Dictyobacter sp. S3.2.2.5]|uniref:HdeD family acid-resistance protein n=1 Tax=Dictyobacter halimunensis TaxID=3026934 RepID=A0ABQ6G693_9CHLR|nr:hypothetical protein KDH_71550 [Dictyobacter sp. S3.2.2.5]